MTVNVSGGGLFTPVATPLTSVTLLSLVESRSCPCATWTTTREQGDDGGEPQRVHKVSSS
jgi:hypothetical protein